MDKRFKTKSKEADWKKEDFTDFFQKLKSGNKSTQSLFFNCNFPVFKRMLCKKLGEKSGFYYQVDDIISIAFTRIFLKLDTFKGNSYGELILWSNKIVYSVFCSYVKKSKHSLEILPLFEDLENFPEINTSQEKECYVNLRKATFKANLAPRMHQVVLEYLRTSKTSEIALKLSLSKDTVRGYRYSAYPKIKKEYLKLL